MIEYRGARYEPAEFDRQFNPRLLAADPDAIQPRRAALSEALRARRKHTLGIAYGTRPRETIDIFPAIAPDAPEAPVLVYFHGGYWRTGTARENNFIAEPFLDAGACVALVNYDLCPDAPIGTLVDQARRAIRWLHENAQAHGGDGDQLTLLGHSAGAHLAAMALADDTGTTPLQAVRGAALVGGIYDLDPVIRATVNKDIGLTKADIAPFSALNHAPRAPVPLIIAVGLAESTEWIRQSRLFADFAAQAGCAVERVDLEGADHYAPLFDLSAPGDRLAGALVAMMGLG